MIDKLLSLLDDQTSQGVKDNVGSEVIAKDAKFTKSVLSTLDFTAVELHGWTDDEHTNTLVRQLVINYLKKHTRLLDVVLNVHLILDELDDREDKVGIAQPAEYVVKDGQILVAATESLL